MDKEVISEESNEETMQSVSNPFLPLPKVRLPLVRKNYLRFIRILFLLMLGNQRFTIIY
jgi:hypothetical protein